MEVKVFNYDHKKVFKGCLESLKNLNISLESVDSKSQTISGVTESTFWSWGERIQIQLKKQGPLSTKVIIESSTVAQLLSWGRNQKNEEILLQTLATILNNEAVRR